MPITLNPATETDRVRRCTSPEMLRKIEDQIEQNIRFYSVQPVPVISERIETLKREWSIERYLQVNVASLGFMTAFFALTRNRAWALLTCTALSFFLYHGLRGFDPPIPILRRMGVRTRGEIDRELFALKALRGDFRDMPETQPKDVDLRAREVLTAINS